jgi:hypothetical protein
LRNVFSRDRFQRKACRQELIKRNLLETGFQFAVTVTNFGFSGGSF